MSRDLDVSVGVSTLMDKRGTAISVVVRVVVTRRCDPIHATTVGVGSAKLYALFIALRCDLGEWMAVDGMLTSHLEIYTTNRNRLAMVGGAAILSRTEGAFLEVLAAVVSTSCARAGAPCRVGAHEGFSRNGGRLGVGAKVAVLCLGLVVNTLAGGHCATCCHACCERRVPVWDVFEVRSTMALFARHDKILLERQQGMN